MQNLRNLSALALLIPDDDLLLNTIRYLGAAVVPPAQPGSCLTSNPAILSPTRK